MANSAGMCTSFKGEILAGIHALGTTVVRGGTGADALKMALYSTSATVSAATTAYSATNEVTATTGYTAGGASVTNATAPSTSGTAAIWTPSASVSWTVTGTMGPFDCALLYNSTQSNKAIAAYTFSAQTVTNGTFTLTMPANSVGTALIQIS